jgi:hypothetical protein
MATESRGVAARAGGSDGMARRAPVSGLQSGQKSEPRAAATGTYVLLGQATPEPPLTRETTTTQGFKPVQFELSSGARLGLLRRSCILLELLARLMLE